MKTVLLIAGGLGLLLLAGVVMLMTIEMVKWLADDTREGGEM